MGYFRHLTPLLRVASVLGLLFSCVSLAALVACMGGFFTSQSFPQWTVKASRVVVIAGNLGMVGGACSFAVYSYTTRFRELDGGPFPLDSWQSQARAIGVMAALPICALVLAVAIPPTALAFEVVFPISILGALALLAATIAATIVVSFGR